MLRQICQITKDPFLVSDAEHEYCRANELPFPIYAPALRIKQLLSFRNRIHLSHTTCALSKKPIFTAIPPEKNLCVYDVDVWESDQWDGLSYGKPYDFNRSFFEQFYELYLRVPRPNLAVIRSTMENSDYTNGITSAKNCYLVFAASRNEDCLFSRMINDCKNVVDCVMATSSELCYNCKDIVNCYNLKFSTHCHTCSDSYFLHNCQGCSNCYGSANLVNKEYFFNNKKYSKEEYLKKLQAIDLGSFKVVCEEQQKFLTLSQNFPIKYLFGKNNENSTGNFLNNTKNCQDCYFTTNAEDLEHCVWVDGGKTSFFYCMYGNGSELIYNSISCGDEAYNLKFCMECWPGAYNLEYCMYTGYGSSHCFGCMGLKKKSYCILNKQYSKNDYLQLSSQIKAQMRNNGEYGRFFPIAFTPYAYNRSEAIDFVPLTKAVALAEGFSWQQDEPESDVPAETVPDHIQNVGNDILEKQLICTRSQKKYRIIKEELAFYRRSGLPLPQVAPLERIKGNSSVLDLGTLHQENCTKCQTPIQTAHEKGRANIYCEPCFQHALI